MPAAVFRWIIHHSRGFAWISIAAGLAAAVVWLMSALAPLPLAPGAAIGGTLSTDPFNVALRHSAWLNMWAAGLTGVSVAFFALAEGCKELSRSARRDLMRRL
jgi:hypothetical protein